MDQPDLPFNVNAVNAWGTPGDSEAYSEAARALGVGLERHPPSLGAGSRRLDSRDLPLVTGRQYAAIKPQTTKKGKNTMAATIVSCRFIPRGEEPVDVQVIPSSDLTLAQVRQGIINAYYVEAVRDGLTSSEAQEYARLMTDQVL